MISLDHLVLLTCAVLALYFIVKRRRVAIYLLDFTCYRPPDSHRMPKSMFSEYIQLEDRMDNEGKALQVKIMERSGYSDETYIPLSLTEMPVKRCYSSGLDEASTVIFSAVRDLLERTNTSPRAIDILIINNSVFSPTPSLTAMVINRFGMRSNVMSFNLSGMGCSAGIVSVALARDLLKIHRNSLALVVSTEVLNGNWYTGKNKSMLISNCLFRMGSAAILMSSRGQDEERAKYKLKYLVRSNKARDDQSYTCVYQDMDSENQTGILLSKTLVNVAGDALKTNMAILGKLALPLSEQLRYAHSIIRQKVKGGGKTGIYIPNFKKAFEHFCIHAGGKAVIEAIEKSLKLSQEDVEASKMTLFKFGNTSSSSIWYELAYIESKGRMKIGDRVWQIALGSGFKCNSAVWECINTAGPDVENVWKGKF
ncbi:probable 3-ketoacyl-CoA synthase 21 [Punica granatum]|uniref:3-ketoacyl-CoA synthase n=2 Tax=Punica granatum TaxID=22663 RepID=A0A6P8DY45_PUNGR|nr:probable 3-ketoacyl-CoA synthase 21 [Punica granatum]